jgi:hypothetical protein
LRNRFLKTLYIKKAAHRQEWSEEIPAIFYVLKNSPGSPPHCTTIMAIAKSLSSIAKRLLAVL